MIVFTSDNGGLATAEGSPTCNAPLFEGKGWMYDGGVRVPWLVRWKGMVEPGSVCEVPVTGPDHYATFLDCAGINVPDDIDGVSILPLLKNSDSLNREALFWHYPHYGNQGGTPGAAVRMGDYKLIYFFENGNKQLYNLKYDIEESEDLSCKHSDVTDKLYRVLSKWLADSGALIPEANPNY